MKRVIAILIALILVLSACGAPAAEVTPTPKATAVVAKSTVEPTQTITPTPTDAPSREPMYIDGKTVISWPQEGAYELRLDSIGLTITVPQEAAARTIITKGYNYNGIESYMTFYFIREGGYYARMFNVEAVPRSTYFSSYQGAFTSPTIFAVSEDCIYLMTVGEADISPTDHEIELFHELWDAMRNAVYNARIDAPSVLPELDTAALTAKAGELAAKGNVGITRAEAAQLAYDILTAENKDEAYPLRYADVDANSEYAHAVAYLDSYGMLTRFSRDGEDMDGELFRPDEPITRAEFAMLLHRLSFQPSPVWFGDIIETLSTEYWGYFYMNYAWKCGWLALDESGSIRPDEPVTASEAAQAMSVVAQIGYPTPGVDF